MFSKRAILVMLYVLAAPVYLAVWLFGLRKTIQKLRVLRIGWVSCANCGTRNSLNVKSQCKRCGITEYGNRCYCTACRQISRFFECTKCGASIKVL